MNCTSIDWYLSWPEEALTRVSLSYLGKQSIIFPVLVPKVVRKLKPNFDSEQLDESFEIIEEPLTPG